MHYSTDRVRSFSYSVWINDGSCEESGEQKCEEREESAQLEVWSSLMRVNMLLGHGSQSKRPLWHSAWDARLVKTQRSTAEPPHWVSLRFSTFSSEHQQLHSEFWIHRSATRENIYMNFQQLDSHWYFRADTERSQSYFCFHFIARTHDLHADVRVIRAAVIYGFSSINRDITRSCFLWPESQTSRGSVCAAASQTPRLCFYYSTLTSFFKKRFLPISVQIRLCVAPYRQNQTDGALITARRQGGHRDKTQGR